MNSKPAGHCSATKLPNAIGSKFPRHELSMVKTNDELVRQDRKQIQTRMRLSVTFTH